MIDFAIRDDDVNAWTTPNELNSLYAPLWEQRIPISFAVIPYSVRSHFLGDVDRFYQETEPRSIEDNPKLIAFLKPLVDQRLVDILLHGHSHLYALKTPQGIFEPATQAVNDRERNGRPGALPWIPECLWKNFDQLRSEWIEGRQLLERLFGKKIDVFVPPSNRIGVDGAKVLDELSLHLSGILQLKPDRPLSVSYLKAYLKRWTYRLVRGHSYPFPLQVGSHQELAYYPLTPGVSPHHLKTQLDHCIKHKAPFVLATHYWELNQHPSLRENFYTFFSHLNERGVNPRRLSEIFPGP